MLTGYGYEVVKSSSRHWQVDSALQWHPYKNIRDVPGR
jgi:hypothetical protein